MKQEMIRIEAADLLDNVEHMKDDGCRLVQICCTRVPEGFELTYSFDKDYCLSNLRLTVSESAEVSSITGIYWPAFVYENEIRDLFGVSICHMVRDVDYGGKYFRLAEKTPWRDLPPQHPAPAKKPAAVKAAPAVPSTAVASAATAVPAATAAPVAPAASAAPAPEKTQPEGEKQNG